MVCDATGGKETLVQTCKDKERCPEGEEESYCDGEEESSCWTGMGGFFRFGEGDNWMSGV